MKRRTLSAALILLIPMTAPAQSDVVVPGDNLVTEGIPKVSAKLAQDAGRYAEFRSAAMLSWHPTKREMLVGTRFADTRQVHLVKMPGGARTQLTFFPDSVGGASFQPKTGDYFVFGKDTGGSEFYQLYRFDPATGGVTLLTDGKSRNSQGSWSTAGDRIAYTSTRRTGKDVDVYVMDPADPKSDKLLAKLEGGGWSPLDWSPDDRKLLVGEYVSINESYLWLMDAATGEKAALTPKNGGKTAYLGGEFSRDGKSVYTTTDRDGEFRRLVRIDLESKQHTALGGQVNGDVEGFELAPDGKTVAYTTNENGVGGLRLWDVEAGKEKPAPRLPAKGVLSGLEWHKSGKEIGFTLSSARSPADAYSLDVTTGTVERWTFSETGGLNPATFSEPELVEWKSFDGRTITGFLYRPPAKFTGKRPVVMNIHGGPEGQFRPGFLGQMNYLLNELGVALLFPNIRGSSGYGKTFLQLDNGVLREGAYKDVGALFDWIKSRPDLDADRVMVTGGSYGGHMTLVVAYQYSDRIRSALDVVGPSNLVTFLKNTSGYRQDLRRAEYGDERDEKVREFLERTAPLNNVEKIKKPLFIVQGKNDPRVPLSESEQMLAAVKKNNTPVWYLMAKDEGHGFAKRKNADFLFYSTVQFVQEYLLK